MSHENGKELIVAHLDEGLEARFSERTSRISTRREEREASDNFVKFDSINKIEHSSEI